jgi:hypothetical protein
MTPITSPGRRADALSAAGPLTAMISPAAEEPSFRPMERRPPGLLATWSIAPDLDVATACGSGGGQVHGSQISVTVQACPVTGPSWVPGGGVAQWPAATERSSGVRTARDDQTVACPRPALPRRKITIYGSGARSEARAVEHDWPVSA